MMLGAGLPAFASKELAQKNACLACHGVDKKILGPAYLDVAQKYAGQKDAQAVLAKSIKAGGAGNWGPIPMPAQPGLSDSDAQALAGWILQGAK
ncbi:MAG: c-type cytochrome [Burkholderiaceae bacterium]|nr:c-type cytochrome [Burkholderiaceae bacterium]